MDLFLRAADGRTWVIAAPQRVGRDPACEIALNDERASRVHALLWRDGDALCLRDEGSSNGTFINELALPPGQVYRLKPGDQLRIGRTYFAVEAAAVAPPPVAPAAPSAPWPLGATQVAPLPPRRSRGPALALGGCLALLVLLLCGGGGFLAAARPPVVQTALAQFAPGDTRLTILSTSPPPTPVSPAAFTANQAALFAAIAELNQAELAVIAHARQQAGGRAGLARLVQQASDLNPEELAGLEKELIKVAVMADGQAQAMAAQSPSNSDAALAIADTYATLAQQAAAASLKIEELRQAWQAQTISADAVATKVAEVAGTIWNAVITDPLGTPGNPFAAYAADPSAVPAALPLTPTDFATLLTQLNNPAGDLSWLAVSPANGEETLTVPPLTGEQINPFDPAVTANLIADSSPADPAQLVQVAGALLGANPADVTAPTTVTVPKVAVVAQTPASGSGQTPPAFPNGKVVIITPDIDPTDVLGTAVGVDANNTPAVTGQTPVKEQPPLVTLTISDLTIQTINKRTRDSSNLFEADVTFSFNVQWTTNLKAPQFEIACAGGSRFAVTTASGSQAVKATGILILYPGTQDAYCTAASDGNAIGYASIQFLVGEAAGATERANQVETDTVNLNSTLTAEAQGTADLQQTEAAQTQAVVGTADALSTEQAVTQAAEAAATATYLAANEARFATETQAALAADDDHDGVKNADDRCFDQAETNNGWRDEDGCPDTLPTMNISQASFVETVTGADVGSFSSLANLTVNFAGSVSSGTLAGSSSWVGPYKCFNSQDPSETYEVISADYKASYTAEVAGSASGTARTFSAPLSVVGVTHITTTNLFTNEHCVALNGQHIPDDNWTGTGTLSGTWDGNTLGTLATNWKVNALTIAGTWSGTVTLTE
jgi:hypothetical protein